MNDDLTANAGLGLAFFAIYFFAFALFLGIMYSGLFSGKSIAIAMAAFVVIVMIAALFHATLQVIYSAVLFHFTQDKDEEQPQFPLPEPMRDLLGSAFEPKTS